MICPACSTENRDGIAFCEECGENLLIQGRCGHTNRPGVSFCETCGGKLGVRAVGAIRSTVEPDRVDVEVQTRPMRRTTEADSTIRTSACGHVNRSGTSFCETCGQQIRPAATPSRPTRRWKIAAAVILVGGSVGAFVVLRPQDPPTPQELVARLPDPAAINDCAELSGTAGDFIHAAAVVAVEAPSLVTDIDQFGSGYSDRLATLGCAGEEILRSVQTMSRPSEGATAAEIVEYFLTGVDVAYPEVPTGSVSTGDG